MHKSYDIELIQRNRKGGEYRQSTLFQFHYNTPDLMQYDDAKCEAPRNVQRNEISNNHK